MTNYVELSGSLIGVAEVRELADGTEVIQWRMKVAREDSGNDSVPCVTSDVKVRKLISKLKEENTFDIVGEVRSRFWRNGGQTQSRVEIEVFEASRTS